MWVFAFKVSLFVLIYSKIIGVVEVSRHGARSPLEKYSWDGSDWKVSPGELTHEGVTQQYLLGKEFRQRYIIKEKVVSESYKLTEVYIRSTDYHRTLMSAQAQMIGFFPNGPVLHSEEMRTKAVPPFAFESLNATIESLGLEALPGFIQPVAIELKSTQTDSLLLGFNKENCPIMSEILKDVQQTDKYKSEVENYKNTLQPVLFEIFNKTIGFEEAGFIGDALYTLKFHGFSLLHGITDEIYDKLLGIRDYAATYRLANNAERIGSSAFYSEVLSVFDKLIAGSLDKK